MASTAPSESSAGSNTPKKSGDCSKMKEGTGSRTKGQGGQGYYPSQGRGGRKAEGKDLRACRRSEEELKDKEGKGTTEYAGTATNAPEECADSFT